MDMPCIRKGARAGRLAGATYHIVMGLIPQFAFDLFKQVSGDKEALVSGSQRRVQRPSQTGQILSFVSVSDNESLVSLD